MNLVDRNAKGENCGSFELDGWLKHRCMEICRQRDYDFIFVYALLFFFPKFRNLMLGKFDAILIFADWLRTVKLHV